MLYSKERLKRVYDWENDQLEKAEKEGKLVLETVCLFVHACVKHGQYQYVAQKSFLRHLERKLTALDYLSSFGECYMQSTALWYIRPL